jgi:transient receptor potential cation channel subfamily A protein 1
MHYATKLGLVSCLKSLMHFGACVSTLNNENQSPLHFAAKYGRINSCLQILSSVNYKNFINEKDGEGCTPLHLAAQNGHSKVMKILLQKGALIFKNYKGNNPFHEAAKNSYTECMSILYNIDINILDSVNKCGVTITISFHCSCYDLFSSTGYCNSFSNQRRAF